MIRIYPLGWRDSSDRSPRAWRRRSRGRFWPSVGLMEGRILLSTLTVLNNQDGGPGSLRDAIDTANAGDTIDFDAGLDGQTIALTGGELAIDKDLDIVGPGAGALAISGGGAGRVFHITAAGAGVAISGLTIAGGSAAQGGGILDEGGALTLADDTLEGNQAVGAQPGDPGQGGAVADIGAGASLSVERTSFLNNLAQGAAAAGTTGGEGDGGAIYGGAGTTLTVSSDGTNTVFSGNRAIGGRGNGIGGDAVGGAIDTVAAGSTVAIANSVLLDGNQALGGAGGAFVTTGAGGIGGDAYGGALAQTGPAGATSTLSVGLDLFNDNVAQGGVGGPSSTSFGGSGGGNGEGGAIYAASPGLTVALGGQFNRNQAVGGGGVAASARGGPSRSSTRPSRSASRPNSRATRPSAARAPGAARAATAAAAAAPSAAPSPSRAPRRSRPWT
jgi:hypothetical protein